MRPLKQFYHVEVRDVLGNVQQSRSFDADYPPSFGNDPCDPFGFDPALFFQCRPPVLGNRHKAVPGSAPVRDPSIRR